MTKEVEELERRLLQTKDPLEKQKLIRELQELVRETRRG